MVIFFKETLYLVKQLFTPTFAEKALQILVDNKLTMRSQGKVGCFTLKVVKCWSRLPEVAAGTHP